MTSQAWVIVISLTFKSKKCSRLSWPIFLFVTIFCLGPQPAAQRGHSLGGSSLLRRWPHGVLQHELQGSFRYNLGGWMDGHGFPPEIKRNPIKSPVFYSFPGKGSGASSIKKLNKCLLESVKWLEIEKLSLPTTMIHPILILAQTPPI